MAELACPYEYTPETYNRWYRFRYHLCSWIFRYTITAALLYTYLVVNILLSPLLPSGALVFLGLHHLSIGGRILFWVAVFVCVIASVYGTLRLYLGMARIIR